MFARWVGKAVRLGQSFRSKLIGTQTLDNFYKPQSKTLNHKAYTLNSEP